MDVKTQGYVHGLVLPCTGKCSFTPELIRPLLLGHIIRVSPSSAAFAAGRQSGRAAEGPRDKNRLRWQSISYSPTSLRLPVSVVTGYGPLCGPSARSSRWFSSVGIRFARRRYWREIRTLSILCRAWRAGKVTIVG
ncbi:hypothetical protein KC363_g239 [Hortaea werneckii]|nr:hypothetical protein KC363_g239 [Hortaea werneckii]